MLETQNDSSSSGGRVLRGKWGQLFVVHFAVLFVLVGFAISNQASPTLISDAVQAEFVASDMAAPAPVQLAQPAVETRTAREN